MDQRIQAIYEAFSSYAKPKDFPTCQCCLTDEEKRNLLAGKLTELSAKELSSYAADVFLTVGSGPDFKYFLPRILELSVNDEFSWPDPQVVMGKLKLAEWSSWPEREQQAITDLLKERFELLLRDEHTTGAEIDTWVCALGHCFPDVTPFLDPLLAEANEEKLLSFFEWSWPSLSKGKLPSAFWHGVPDNERRVIDWLNQDRVKQLLTEKYGMVF